MFTWFWTPNDKTLAVSSYVAVIVIFMLLDYLAIEEMPYLVHLLLGH